MMASDLWPPLRDADDLTPPPADVEAEQAMLGAMLIGNPEALEALAICRPEMCYREQHTVILAAIRALAEASQPVDTVTVAGALRDAGTLEDVAGGLEYLASLEGMVPFSTRAAAYAERVVTCYHRRQQAATLRQMARQVTDGTLVPSETLRRAYDALSATQPRRSTAEPVDMGPDLWAGWAEPTSYMTPIPTGFPALDEALVGGWQRHQVYLLTARTGKGKTSLALHFLLAAARAGRRVGFVSMEMPRYELAARILAMEADVPLRLLRRGCPPAGTRWRRPHEAHFVDVASEAFAAIERLDAMLAGNPAAGLVIDDADGCPAGDLALRCRYLVEVRHCEMLIVDHMGEVSADDPAPGTNPAYVDMLACNTVLQREARSLAVPILAVAQQNLDKGHREITDDNLAGAKKVATQAPAILLLDTDFTGPVATAKLALGKNRDGTTLLGQRAIVLTGDYDTFAWRQDGADQGDDDDAT